MLTGKHHWPLSSDFYTINYFLLSLWFIINNYVCIFFSGFSCSAFSNNTSPNLPIQIMAITEPVGALLVTNEISQQLLNDGSLIADKLKAQFVTFSNSSTYKSSFYTPFFRDVLSKKSEIEKAFQMEEPSNLKKINTPSKIEHSKINDG